MWAPSSHSIKFCLILLKVAWGPPLFLALVFAIYSFQNSVLHLSIIIFGLIFKKIFKWKHKWNESVIVMKMKVLVVQSCLMLCDAIDCSPPGSSVHEILQAGILGCVAIPFSRGSSWPRDQTWVFCIASRFFFTIWTTREVLIVLVGILPQVSRLKVMKGGIQQMFIL